MPITSWYWFRHDCHARPIKLLQFSFCSSTLIHSFFCSDQFFDNEILKGELHHVLSVLVFTPLCLCRRYLNTPSGYKYIMLMVVHTILKKKIFIIVDYFLVLLLVSLKFYLIFNRIQALTFFYILIYILFWKQNALVESRMPIFCIEKKN